MKLPVKILPFILAAAMLSCGDNTSDRNLQDPSTVQEPSDAIPDSTKIVNDSVIVPDTGNGNQDTPAN